MGLTAAALLVAVAVACIAIPSVAAPCHTQTCEARWASLTAQSADTGVVALTSASYRDLLRTAPRNYSALLLLTASQNACPTCAAARAELSRVAAAAIAARAAREFFFAALDLAEAPDVFERLQAQAPAYFLVRSQGAPERLAIPNLSANAVATQLMKLTGRKIPLDQADSGLPLIVGLVLIGSVTAWTHRATLLRMFPGLLRNPALWGICCAYFVILLLSGQMWMSMRGAPLLSGSSLIAPSSSRQNGIESYMFMGAQALFGYAVYCLIHLAGRRRTLSRPTGGATAGDEGMGVGGWSLVLFAMFSVLCGMFARKVPGYPYRLIL